MAEHKTSSKLEQLHQIGEKFLSPLELRTVRFGAPSDKEKEQIYIDAIERETRISADNILEIIGLLSRHDQIIGFRPVSKSTLELFRDGCLGKGIDIHAKSSREAVPGEKGIHALAGMICYQQAFSKLGSDGLYDKALRFNNEAKNRIQKDSSRLSRVANILISDYKLWKQQNSTHSSMPKFEITLDELEVRASTFGKYVTKSPLCDSKGKQIYGFLRKEKEPYKKDNKIIFATRNAGGAFTSKTDGSAIDLLTLADKGFKPVSLETIDYATKVTLNPLLLEQMSQEDTLPEKLLTSGAISIESQPLTADYDLFMIGTPVEKYKHLSASDREVHFGSDPAYEDVTQLESYRGVGTLAELELTDALCKLPSIIQNNAITHGPETNNPAPEALPSIKVGATPVVLDTLDLHKHFRPVMLENTDIEPYVFFIPDEKGSYQVTVLYDKKQILKLYNMMEKKNFFMPVSPAWKWRRNSEGKLTDSIGHRDLVNYKLATQRAKQLIKSGDKLKKFIMHLSELKIIDNTLYRYTLQHPAIQDEKKIKSLMRRRTFIEQDIFSLNPTVANILLTEEQFANAKRESVFSFLKSEDAIGVKNKLYERGITESLLEGDYARVESIISKEVAALNDELEHVSFGIESSKRFRATNKVKSFLKFCTIALNELEDNTEQQKRMLYEFLFGNRYGNLSGASMAAIVSANTNDHASFRLAYELALKFKLENKFCKQYITTMPRGKKVSPLMQFIESCLGANEKVRNADNHDILVDLIGKYVARFNQEDFIKNTLECFNKRLKSLKYDNDNITFTGQVIHNILTKSERYKMANIAMENTLQFVDISFEVGGAELFKKFLTTEFSEHRTLIDFAARITKNTGEIDNLKQLWSLAKQHHCESAFTRPSTQRQLKKARLNFQNTNKEKSMNIVDEILEYNSQPLSKTKYKVGLTLRKPWGTRIDNNLDEYSEVGK